MNVEPQKVTDRNDRARIEFQKKKLYNQLQQFQRQAFLIDSQVEGLLLQKQELLSAGELIISQIETVNKQIGVKEIIIRPNQPLEVKREEVKENGNREGDNGKEEAGTTENKG